jgi:D-alanyl-D-alanine carboxypeptidase
VIRTRSRWIRRSIYVTDALLRNHNRFLDRFPGADGIKTGFVNQSGHCLVAAATRLVDGKPWRLISVVLNSPNTTAESGALLNFGFRAFRPTVLAAPNTVVAQAAVRGGARSTVPLEAPQGISAIVPLALASTVRYDSTVSELAAPLRAGSAAGDAAVAVGGRVIRRVPLVVAADVPPSLVNRVARGGGWPWGMLLGLSTAAAGGWYARTAAQGSRRRRRRVPAPRRGVDRRRAGDGQWIAGAARIDD